MGRSQDSLATSYTVTYYTLENKKKTNRNSCQCKLCVRLLYPSQRYTMIYSHSLPPARKVSVGMTSGGARKGPCLPHGQAMAGTGAAVRLFAFPLFDLSRIKPLVYSNRVGTRGSLQCSSRKRGRSGGARRPLVVRTAESIEASRLGLRQRGRRRRWDEGVGSFRAIEIDQLQNFL